MAKLPILGILQIFLLAVSHSKYHGNNNGGVCQTEECRQIAHAFAVTMNKSVDPCVNFYEYVCGGWKFRNPIPKYESAWSRFLFFKATAEKHIKDELETEITLKDILPVRQAKKWYHSCMDSKTRESRGIKPIDSIMMEAGGWPMIMDTDEWNEEMTWQEVAEHYTRLMGDYAFYNMRLMPPWEDHSTSPTGVLALMSPKLPLDDVIPKHYRNYTADDVNGYKLLIKDIARVFIEHNKADVPDEQLEKDINDLIEFEKSIYLSSHYQDSMDVVVKNVEPPLEPNLKNFLKWWDQYAEPMKNISKAQIDWRNTIEQLFARANANMKDNMAVLMSDPKYFYLLSTVLGATDTRTIVNYIHWRFVSQMLKYTTDEMKNKLSDVMEEGQEIGIRPPRWRECVREMEMKDAMAFIFVEKYFHNRTIEAVRKIIENIKSQLRGRIDNSNWMTSEVREDAKNKLDEMKTLLGYPNWYNNKTAVNNHYKGLTIGYDYLDNILSFMRNEKRRKVREVAGLVENDKWEIDPTEVDALYTWETNTVNIPAVDFQSPLFAPGVPDYVNYGTAGILLSHEMSHGFDPEGVQHGVNTSNKLLDENMMKLYYHQVKCFIKKFDRYSEKNGSTPEVEESIEEPITLDDMEDFDPEILNAFRGSDGVRTASENIADAIGIQSAFGAYQRMREAEKPNGEFKLPGFEEFTDEQMFFISFGQTWCHVTDSEFVKRKIVKDTHSPPSLRVIGTASNTLDFGRVFHCPKGSPMSPKNKCDMWTMSGAVPTLESSKRSGRHTLN